MNLLVNIHVLKLSHVLTVDHFALSLYEAADAEGYEAPPHTTTKCGEALSGPAPKHESLVARQLRPHDGSG